MSTNSPVARHVQKIAADLGSTLGSERARRRWTLRQLAERAGLSRSMAQFVEGGEAASLATYTALAAALGLRLDCELVDPRARDRIRVGRARPRRRGADIAVRPSTLARIGS